MKKSKELSHAAWIFKKTGNRFVDVALSAKQLGDWPKKGLKVCVSVNFSSRDLNNNSLLLYTKKYIDKYFIDNVCSAKCGKLVEDVISLIHHLGKRVLAEGIETIGQIEALKMMILNLWI